MTKLSCTNCAENFCGPECECRCHELLRNKKIKKDRGYHFNYPSPMPE